MEIRLLGPVELAAGDAPSELGSPRSRAVLVALALQPNRVMTIDRLIDAVWDAAPPATAQAQIRICVSDLRRAFRQAGLSARIETRPSGYRLEVAESELDVTEFGRLVGSARDQDPATAAATLRAAEALWRGPALSGVPGAVARAAATRLDDARLAATEQRIELELELGRHLQVIPELRELVDSTPLREGLHRSLMLALYRAGRQAEALETYRRARTTLVDELGVEPGPDLRDLQRAVLDGSRRLAAAPSAAAHPRQLPAGIADFTGREEQLAGIRDHLGGEDSSYGVRIVAVSGPGGVGKSTLAIRAAHELAADFPDGQLYADVRAAGGNDPVMATLGRFLHALGVAGPAVPADQQARVELYRSRLAGRRMLVLLDDVTSEDDVRPLLPGEPGCGVVVTSRARLSGLPGALLVDIGMLDVARSMRLLGRLLGVDRVATEREPARQLAELCAGLPLALRISAARLAARPHWPVAQLVDRLRDENRRLDELAHHGQELRATIGLSYQAIDDEARRLFRLFALVRAADVPAWTAAALLDADPAAAAEVLERLVDGQLVTAVRYDDGRGVRYRFHDLVQVYAAEMLAATESPADRQAALGRLLGGWLSLAEVAHRREYGGDHTVLHGTAPRWRPDPTEVSDPIVWLDRERAGLVSAVGQAAEAGLDDLCWDLALTLVTLFEVKGYFEDWQLTSSQAARAAEQAGNRLGVAAMNHSLGSLHSLRNQLDQAAALLTAAVDEFRALGHDHGAGLALRNLASVYRLRGDLAAARRYGAEALDLLHSAGDPVGEAHLLSRLALIELADGALDPARKLADRALTLIRSCGYRRGIAQALHVSGLVYLQAAELPAARRTLRQALELVRELDDQVGTVHALTALGRVEPPERGADLLRQAAALARSFGQDYLAERAERAIDGAS